MSSFHFSLPSYVFKVHIFKGIHQLNEIFVQLFVNVFAEKYSECLHVCNVKLRPCIESNLHK